MLAIVRHKARGGTRLRRLGLWSYECFRSSEAQAKEVIKSLMLAQVGGFRWAARLLKRLLFAATEAAASPHSVELGHCRELGMSSVSVSTLLMPSIVNILNRIKDVIAHR